MGFATLDPSCEISPRRPRQRAGLRRPDDRLRNDGFNLDRVWHVVSKRNPHIATLMRATLLVRPTAVSERLQPVRRTRYARGRPPAPSIKLDNSAIPTWRCTGGSSDIETVWHEHFDRHPDPFVRNFIYSRLSDVDNADTVYGDRALFLCAVGEAGIIGTGAIKPLDDRACEMARMFVAAPYRGRGVGRAIAGELIKFALGAGYDLVRLSSNNALAASHRLYESIGFQSTPPWESGGEAHSRYYALRIGRSV